MIKIIWGFKYRDSLSTKKAVFAKLSHALDCRNFVDAAKLGRFSGTFLGQERLLTPKNPNRLKDQADLPQLRANFDFFNKTFPDGKREAEKEERRRLVLTNKAKSLRHY